MSEIKQKEYWEVELAEEGTLLAEFQKDRTAFVSQMFDESKKDEFFLKYGIYNTSKLYAQLDKSVSDLLSQALQKQREEIIKLIKTPMSTEFEDPEEESADYSIEDFRARLLSNLTTKKQTYEQKL